jgi:hypothetical protein
MRSTGLLLKLDFPRAFCEKTAVQDASFASDEQERGRKVENQPRQFASGFGEVILRCAFRYRGAKEESRHHHPGSIEEHRPRPLDVPQKHRILAQRH